MTRTGWAVLAGVVGLAGWAVVDLFAGVALSPGNVVGFLRRAWPPDFPPAAEVVAQTGRTLAVVLLATALSVVLGGVLAILATVGVTRRGRVVGGVARAVSAAARATPDVVLAVVFARLLGLGETAAVLAMGLHSAGMVGRLGAAAVGQVDQRPRLALRAAGASRAQEFGTAVVPAVVPAFIAIGLHRFDVNLRVSAILGFVGSTGIGTEVATAFGRLDYPRGMAWAALLFLLCVLVEAVSSAARRAVLRAPGKSFVDSGGRTSPPWTARRVAGWASVVAGVAVLVWAGGVLDVTAQGDVLATLALFWPPGARGADLVGALLVTVQVAVAGTALGALLAVPLGSLAARTTAPNPVVRGICRVAVTAVRSTPELVLGVVFVVTTGLGPAAGALALAFGASGLLGKLVADSLEHLPPHPARALRAAGASRLQAYFGATLPQAFPELSGHVLYQLDADLRAATLLGLVGGGGIGLYLLQAMRTREYPVVTAVLLVLFGVVLGLDLLASWLIRRVR